MDQPQPIRTVHDAPQRAADLVVVLARQDPHDRRHRPREPETVVRPADGGDHGPVLVVWVCRGEEEGPRRLVGSGGGVEVPVQRRGEEGGDVGVVHQVLGAVAVDFVGVESLFCDWVRDDAVRFDCGAQTGGQVEHCGCEVGGERGVECGHYAGARGEVATEHHVCWNEELVDTTVV